MKTYYKALKKAGIKPLKRKKPLTEAEQVKRDGRY